MLKFTGHYDCYMFIVHYSQTSSGLTTIQLGYCNRLNSLLSRIDILDICMYVQTVKLVKHDTNHLFSCPNNYIDSFKLMVLSEERGSNFKLPMEDATNEHEATNNKNSYCQLYNRLLWRLYILIVEVHNFEHTCSLRHKHSMCI